MEKKVDDRVKKFHKMMIKAKDFYQKVRVTHAMIDEDISVNLNKIYTKDYPKSFKQFGDEYNIADTWWNTCGEYYSGSDTHISGYYERYMKEKTQEAKIEHQGKFKFTKKEIKQAIKQKISKPNDTSLSYLRDNTCVMVGECFDDCEPLLPEDIEEFKLLFSVKLRFECEYDFMKNHSCYYGNIIDKVWFLYCTICGGRYHSKEDHCYCGDPRHQVRGCVKSKVKCPKCKKMGHFESQHCDTCGLIHNNGYHACIMCNGLSKQSFITDKICTYIVSSTGIIYPLAFVITEYINKSQFSSCLYDRSIVPCLKPRSKSKSMCVLQ